MRRAAFIFIMLIAVLPTPSAAQAPILTGDETWTEDRLVNGTLVVPNGTRLRVVGATVTFAPNSSLVVEAGGTLEVRSLPDRAAVLQGENNTGWTATINGTIDMRGLPHEPVSVLDLGGFSGASGPTAAFRGGMTVDGGRIDADHVRFMRYSAGLLVTDRAWGNLTNLSFESNTGQGFVASSAHVQMRDARFVGGGGRAFVTVPASEPTLRNLSFEGTEVGLTVRNGAVTVIGVRGTNVTTCVQSVGNNNLTLRNLECRDFRRAALELTTAPNQRGEPAADVSGLWASSPHPVTAAVVTDRSRSLVVRDAEIGPINGSAFSVQRASIVTSNVSFSGVARYNYFFQDPDANFTNMTPSGEAGALGWQYLGRTAFFVVLDEQGRNLTGATLRVTDPDGNLVGERARLATHTASILLEAATVDAQGVTHERVYRIEAEGPSGDRKTLDGFKPTGATLTIRLSSGNDTPAWGALALLALAGAALVARRRR